MSTRYKGSILSSTAAVSSSTAAYGLWKQSEVAQLINTAWPKPDPYWTSVSMLLHGDGTVGAQNNTFIDISSNAFSITRNGAATQGTFSPFTATAPYSASVSSGSSYSGASGDYLSVANNAAFDFGTGNFTIEAWVNLSNLTLPKCIVGCYPTANPIINGYEFFITSSGFISFDMFSSSVNQAITATNNVISLNTWTHVAITKSSTSYLLFVNGNQCTTNTITAAANNTNGNLITFGYSRYSTFNHPMIGYMSNIRVVKGTAVYTAAFTPPTSPLTAISGTSLLLGFTNAGVIDNAMQNNLVTVGTSQISTIVLKYGTGSLAFSGSGAWLTAPNATVLQLNTGDFTIEGWVQVNAIGTAYAIVSKGAASTGWSVNITSGNKLQFSYTATALVGATSLIAGAWYYFAVVRSGSGSGNLVIYLNGTADATSGGAVTDNFNQTNILYVGASRTGTTPLNGYIDELRITKGVARYTANFTSPQQAFPSQ